MLTYDKERNFDLFNTLFKKENTLIHSIDSKQYSKCTMITKEYRQK